MDATKASEAIYGFCGWLTTRKEKTVMSSSSDCAIIADLVKEFCEVNKLSEPSEKWHENLIHPDGECSHNKGEPNEKLDKR